MSSKRRVLQNVDGSVSVIIPAPNSQGISELEQDWLDRVFAKANPDNLTFTDCVSSDLPTRRFRNSWKPSGISAEVDLVKAKVQVFVELRRSRDKELAITDGSMAKENEQGNASSQATVKQYRQKLRDLPATAQTNIDAIANAAILESEYPNQEGEDIAYYITKAEA